MTEGCDSEWQINHAERYRWAGLVCRPVLARGATLSETRLHVEPQAAPTTRRNSPARHFRFSLLRVTTQH